MIPFIKTNALGNDFILVAHSELSGDASNLATRICDRHFGVGADGLIVWKPGDEGADIRIFNMDGSEAECSGNGLRCAAVYLMGLEQFDDAQIELRTVSGSYPIRRVGTAFETAMGEPGLKPEEIPFTDADGLERIVDYALDVDGSPVRITACSTGNPHCSLFVDSIERGMIESLGPKLENHPAFPNRTNVEFVHLRNRHEIEVAFWERGVGLTFASGTGSCGATVASILNGRTERQVRVHTRAGQLDVEWAKDGKLKLTSTAEVVAEGRYMNS